MACSAACGSVTAMRKLVEFINEIAGILYVGGIASHIVIGAVVGTPDAQTAYTVYT